MTETAAPDVRGELSEMRKALHDLTVTVARIDERTLEGGKQMLSLRTDLSNNYVSNLELTPIKTNIAKLEADLASEKRARENWQTWALRAVILAGVTAIFGALRLKGGL